MGSFVYWWSRWSSFQCSSRLLLPALALAVTGCGDEETGPRQGNVPIQDASTSDASSDAPSHDAPSGCAETLCGVECVDVASNPGHCGACETACEAGQVCSDGTCTTECTAGLSDCDGACIDVRDDPAHCGSCGRACTESEVCSEGMCAAQCASGLVDCAGACVDTSSDVEHCGGCATACAEGEACVGGTCVLDCGDLTVCGSECVNLQTSPSHCGQCGAACASNQVCTSGTCAAVCEQGLVDCSGACVDTMTDPAHCGGCGETCGDLACKDGTCTRCEPIATVAAVPAVVAGSFDGAKARIDPGCGAPGGVEQVISFTAPVAGRYVFGAPGDDVLVSAYDGCDGPELFCETEAGRFSSSYQLAAGRTIAIVVEPATLPAEPFEVRIEQAGTGACCEASSEPGCSEPAIEACVCAVASGCCTNEWNEACVALVNREGCGFCDFPRPPTCGGALCEDLSATAEFYGVESCCSGENECGASYLGSCVELNQPGVRDAACESEKVGSVVSQGCCRNDGRCGLDLSIFGMGCVAREEAPGASFEPVSCGQGSEDLPTFVNFETDQVRPVALSAAGDRLFAVNTPDNRLEIFAVSDAGLSPLHSVPVGMEPVAVAARSDTEVWVVNQLSDSVSIVDLSIDPPRVRRTLWVGDEPRDIVFAGPGKGRAFITTAHRGQNHPVDPQFLTPGVGRADVWVFDAADPGAAAGGTPLTIVNLFGDTPRALAVSADGSTVYAAVFHSGNRTTVLNEGAVSGQLPEPTTNVEGQQQPSVSLIVRFDGSNWVDETGRTWDDSVRFSLPDFDVFAIDANATPPAETSRFAGVGTTLFNMAVNPVSGAVYVSNTDAKNLIRFEPELSGRFADNRITVLDSSNVVPHDLNPHIDHGTLPGTQAERELAVAQPVGLEVSADGSELYVASLGTSEVSVIDTAALEGGAFSPSAGDQIAVTGGGPTGLAFDAARGRLYVMTRFDNGVSAVDISSRQEVQHVTMFTPEPPVVLEGRHFLYDATLSSSHGDSACSGCHIFGDLDAISWDLGDPSAIVTSFHPMKGPMSTQSLRGLANHGPLHWRGDRNAGDNGGDPQDVIANFHEFNPAFVTLLGRDAELTNAQMQSFAEFMMTVTYPPNPVRALDNSLTPAQKSARDIYFSRSVDIINTCNGCHTLDPELGVFGSDRLITFDAEPQNFKVAHLRNLYQKVGMFGMSTGLGAPDTGFMGDQIRGFGYIHDGSVDTLVSFFKAGVFSLNDQEERDMAQFMLAFDSNMAPVVGQQVTVGGGISADAESRLALLVQRARVTAPRRECDLVAKGSVAGEAHGFVLSGQSFISDRAADAALSLDDMLALLEDPSTMLTFTCVPPGSGMRVGVDRDLDGKRDGDELDAGTNPADPAE